MLCLLLTVCMTLEQGTPLLCASATSSQAFSQGLTKLMSAEPWALGEVGLCPPKPWGGPLLAGPLQLVTLGHSVGKLQEGPSELNKQPCPAPWGAPGTKGGGQ